MLLSDYIIFLIRISGILLLDDTPSTQNSCFSDHTNHGAVAIGSQMRLDFDLVLSHLRSDSDTETVAYSIFVAHTLMLIYQKKKG